MWCGTKKTQNHGSNLAQNLARSAKHCHQPVFKYLPPKVSILFFWRTKERLVCTKVSISIYTDFTIDDKMEAWFTNNVMIVMSEKLAFLVLFSQRAESTAGHHGMLVCCFQPARGREHSERNFVTVTSRRRLSFPSCERLSFCCKPPVGQLVQSVLSRCQHEITRT